MIFIFDTDVLIDILRDKNATVLQVEEWSYKADVLACSMITIAEIFAGMRKGEEKKTRELLNSLTVLPLTVKVAETGGRLQNATKSHQLHLDDCLIAATALESNATLFTKNVKHYPFRALRVRAIS
ncbi:MAG: type II toxin-antitoxin system VapC family toxin [Candidatus Gracilibacteria bacterium]